MYYDNGDPVPFAQKHPCRKVRAKFIYPSYFSSSHTVWFKVGELRRRVDYGWKDNVGTVTNRKQVKSCTKEGHGCFYYKEPVYGRWYADC